MTETKFWHPFARMGSVKDTLVPITRGEGCWVWDEDGNKYLDALAGLWFCNIGFGREELAEAAADQARQMCAFQTFDVFTTPPTEELASRVAALVPMEDARVFFTAGGGSEAVDTAAKLARAYWSTVGRPTKQLIIAREMAYHGMNAYGTSLGGIAANAVGLGPLIEGVAHVSWDDPEALRTTIESVGADNVAAFFCEPIVGAGGVFHPPAGYITDVAEICREYDVLFVADEVVSGLGRAGDWFGATRYGIVPDLMTMAKGLTSGYAPLGAVAIGPRVAEPYWDEDLKLMFRHGYTYSGHATACAIGNANLDVLERERLVERVGAMEGKFAESLAPLGQHELVSEIRAGIGFLGAVEIDPAVREQNPELLGQVVREARERGVITRALSDRALQVSPAFVMEEDQLEMICDVFTQSLDAVLESVA